MIKNKIAAVVVALGISLGMAPAEAAPYTNASPLVWNAAQQTVRSPGNLVISKDGKTLVFQQDGNFVLYSPNGTALWASGTANKGKTMVQQADGNVVIYGATGAPLWATGTPASQHDTSTSRIRLLGIGGGSGDCIYAASTSPTMSGGILVHC